MSPDTAISPSVLSPLVMGVLFVAAAFGGALNSVAGGGSFIGFPALLFAGISPVAANATNTVALWPGSVASALQYRSELRESKGKLVPMSIASALGGGGGAALLLCTRESTFVALIPWLLLAATLLFSVGPALGAHFPQSPGTLGSSGAIAAQLVISIYGGYFGAGMGILILASLSLLGMTNIHQMNGLKSILASLINGVAVVMFTGAGAVAWRPGSVMVVGAILGGYLGAGIARRVDPQRVRALVTVVAWAMTGWFFLKPHLA